MFHNLAYHLPIPLRYYNLSTVHLEMLNILVAIKLLCKIILILVAMYKHLYRNNDQYSIIFQGLISS